MTSERLKKLKPFIISLLRKGTYRWPERNEALKLAKVERGIYKCAMCNEIYKRKEVQIDHINPAVPLTGFDGFDNYIDRMFCERTGFQVLCTSCHDQKTAAEKIIRKNNRKKNEI